LYPILPPIHSSGPDLEYYTATAIESGFGDDDLRFGGLKLFVDGHENGAAHCSRMTDETPREDQPLLGRTFEELVMTIVEALKANLQLRMHAWGDFAQRQVVDAMRSAVRSTGMTDHRMRVEHMLNTGYPSVPLAEIRDVGLVPVPQAAFMFNDDPAQGVTKYPFRDAVDEGLVFANSSDCTGSQPTLVSPWVGIGAMLTRVNRNGVPMDPDQGVSLTDALRSYTRGSAYAGFEEKDKGSLEPGKLADMVVLAVDPYVIAPEELAGMRTDMTIVGGEIRYRRS
jgi:predicted amidohydrolase YtcJ